MKFLVKKYSDIKSIENTQITFKTGEKIIFAECLGNRYESAVCVAEGIIPPRRHILSFLLMILQPELFSIKKDYFQNQLTAKDL